MVVLANVCRSGDQWWLAITAVVGNVVVGGDGWQTE